MPPERLVVAGGASLAFALKAGDKATIVDPEGLQPALLHIDSGEPLHLFGDGAPAGTSHSLVAVDDLTVVLEAPGAAMAPHEQSPPTELHILVERAVTAPIEPPAPLAEPKLELRVPAATARAFIVKAGDYIQIIDVAGRQCSDFLAFDARDRKSVV